MSPSSLPVTARRMRARFLSPAVLFSALVLFSSVCFAADPASNTELEGILQKIEARHYRWIAIKADVLVFFAGANSSKAMCGGELLYQRLDERMLLSCTDTRGKLVFGFRTLDRRFDLYLPSKNTIFHGSIFDLEGSPDIESHLKARDLYRALKPLAVDPRHAKVDRDNSAITSLDVFGAKDGKDILTRKLFLSPEGDVRGEVYYDAAGRSATEIQRYDFREVPGQAGSFRSIIYPKKITIISPELKKGTALFFTKVKALDTIDSPEFLLKAPPGTKEVFLDEQNPRFQYSKTLPAKRAAPDTSFRTPAPSANEIPVYYAKPLEITEKKIAPVPAQKEKETPKIEKPVNAPPAKETVGSPVRVPEDTDHSAEADIVVQGSSPDDSTPPYDPNSLDPSVEPKP